MVRYNLDKNLSLEILIPKDSEVIFKLIEKNRDIFNQYFNWLEKTKEEKDILEFIKKNLSLLGNNEGIHYKIIYNNQVCGLIGSVLINHSAETFEIGCWIDKDYYNKGIATKSTYKLVEISFNEFSAKKVELYCALDNTTSNHIANKLGFKLEGTIRNSIKIQDELIPQNIYGMLKEEFSEL